MSRYVLGCLIVVSWMGIAGDVLLKLAGREGEPPRWAWCWLAAGLYASTSFGWFYILRRTKMSTSIGVVYPAIQAVTITAIEVGWFKAILTWREALGMSLGFAAILLLAEEHP